MEMKQIIYLIVLSIVASLSLANPNPIPKACDSGTPDYNENTCKEICTKEPHTTQSYCSNFTSNAGSDSANVPQPSNPSSTDTTGNTGSSTSSSSQDQGEIKPADSGTNKPADNDENEKHEESSDKEHHTSSGISLQSSIILSALSLFLFFILI